VPHEARAALDVRIPFGTDTEAVVAGIERVVMQVAPEVAVEELQLCPPSRTTANSPVARVMVESQRDVGPPPQVWPSAPWWAPSIYRLPAPLRPRRRSRRVRPREEAYGVD
jgi:acetylornithine deacetylase/succinyl-diaminopimelate desuccinylase-like protein